MYYGAVIGFYFAFTVQLIGWLLVPSMAGLALGGYMLITSNTGSNLIPIYALMMALWATLFMESWKRRENELKFCWDMHEFKS